MRNYSKVYRNISLKVLLIMEKLTSDNCSFFIKDYQMAFDLTENKLEKLKEKHTEQVISKLKKIIQPGSTTYLF